MRIKTNKFIFRLDAAVRHKLDAREISGGDWVHESTKLHRDRWTCRQCGKALVDGQVILSKHTSNLTRSRTHRYHIECATRLNII